MQFTPKSDEDCMGLLPERNYAFSIVSATEEHAKSSGNPQFKLSVDIYEGEGVASRIFDYLPTSGRMMFKLRHCCESVGMLKEYESGNVEAHQLVGKSGTLSLRKDAAKNGYAAKNSVSDYITDASAQKSKPSAKPGTPEDPTMPF